MITWRNFDDRAQMVDALEEDTSEALSRAIRRNGRAAWAVSGGSTPKPLFEAMAQVALPWEDVQVALVDERWVDTNHPRSNEAFMRGALQTGLAAEAHFVGMKSKHDNPWEAAADVNKRYSSLAQPFASVLLGMGSDGHTASFFPDAEGLEAALDMRKDALCVALTAKKSEVTGDEVDRMSLSASAIAASPHIALMITGEEKKTVLERALEKDTHLPVARLAEVADITVYWAP
ncbi:6-phosphogluconolactonase [Kordiimonas aestuarii]|uniref:6-phosphogluconolactonase n=1 Tax=Kordiimonas aestuarii TaxID=1005925 RepID=UPI0021CE047D|nr:6-phosphogluconolactonase [Kordiimonas aestuarii]